MKLTLSHYVAELVDTNDTIVVHGNYSIIKKNASLPRHLANTMDLSDFVLLAMKEGTWVDMGEHCGHKVFKIKIGMEQIYVCTQENRIQYLVGLGDF